MSKIPSFLKREGDSLLFNDEGELIFYVPELFFERNHAEIIGEDVSLMGMFNYTIKDGKGKNNGLHCFNLPTVFICKPYEIEKIKKVKLTSVSEIDDYRLLKFKKGDKVMVSVRLPQIVDNAEEFYGMFLSGKIPTTIPYNKLPDYFLQNIRLNGADYGLTIQLFGIIISELCRSKDDINVLFCHTDMKNMNNYTPISIKQAPKLVSPTTSLTSENFDEAVVNAMVVKSKKSTPLERLIL